MLTIPTTGLHGAMCAKSVESPEPGLDLSNRVQEVVHSVGITIRMFLGARTQPGPTYAVVCLHTGLPVNWTLQAEYPGEIQMARTG